MFKPPSGGFFISIREPTSAYSVAQHEGWTHPVGSHIGLMSSN